MRKARQQEYNLKNITEPYFAEAYQEYFAEPFQNDFTLVKKCLDPEHFVRIRENLGGTGKKAMDDQLISAKEKVRKNTEWLEQHRLQIEEAENKRNSIVWM